ncbi:MAG: hypothetical protein OEY77_00280 [Nitrospira sp.]|nr:hypothetical protein [Nitrospira sp.]
MKFRSESTIIHDGKTYDPGMVDLPREVGERLKLDSVEGPTKEEREHEQKKGKK